MPSTRSQAKKQQNVEPMANSQSPPITIKTQEQSNQEQSNICGICRDEFDEATKETCDSNNDCDSTPIIVHKDDAGLWSHSFHAKCIAKWIREKMEEDRVPKCPLCFSTPIPDNIIASMSMVNIDDDDDGNSATGNIAPQSKPIKKEELTIRHPNWAKAKEHLQTGGLMEDIERKYTISDDYKKLLIAAK